MKRVNSRRAALLVLPWLVWGVACAPQRVPAAAPGTLARAGALPPIPPRAGTLAIDVVYPGEGQTLAVRDSNFIFGNVGTGGATLTIGGAPVEVAPNGAFLAFLPVPQDGRYELRATAGGQTAQLTRTVQLPAVPAPPPPPPAPAPIVGPPQAGAPAAPAPPAGPPGTPTLDAPRVAVAASQRADRMTIGTAVPGGGTPFHWFFPATTRMLVTGVQGGQYRVRLTDQLSIWVDTAQVGLLPEGSARPRGFVGSVTAVTAETHIDLRMSTSERLPFRVDGSERGLTVTVYGAQTRTNILQYGRTDPLIHRLDWEVPTEETYVVNVELNEPLWGFHPFWDDRGNLIVRIMRPPPIDPRSPLRGIHIAVDAGHPPGGAIGPTRLTEAEATLAVARRLIPMLTAAGARVLEIRPDTAAVDVNERVRRAMDGGAQLFVSIHFDAFADGTNPFLNYGSHVLFNQPHSLDFAREMQRELLLAFGLPDLGVRKQDIAVIRIQSMPSVLTETMFMMFPEQEAALRDPAALQRIAEAHFRGIEAFLRERATAAAITGR
jgi:N-acetylmuramoyl-L-alanine amidase